MAHMVSKSIMMALILSYGKVHNAEEIAKELEINPRSIREYVNELRLAGVDIRSRTGNQGGGYFLGEKGTTSITRKGEGYCSKFDCPMNNGGYCEGE